MSWRNLREELCDVLAETVEARVPLGWFQPNQSVHVERGGRTTFKDVPQRATCRECRKPFRRRRATPRHVFCSDACQSRYWNRRHRTPLLQEVRACRVALTRCRCGKPARAPCLKVGATPKYCSNKCASSAYRKPRAKLDRFRVRVCACGKAARAAATHGVAPTTCSQNCATLQSKHRRRCVECIFNGAPRCTRPIAERVPTTGLGRPRITDAQRAEAIQMRADRSSVKQIAAHLGISEGYARRLARGAR